ncbi:LAMI_0E04632g1_1 [Lachancea mirantina]|uniref:polynucleotide adenylyltransferase n=1 Tax=Lachancea mirantina TaxID=1230905 RepID=A0A1G4JL54_9SACH|nr:LAMI_0E04632g1_1 [Lachancea mirantina]
MREGKNKDNTNIVKTKKSGFRSQETPKNKNKKFRKLRKSSLSRAQKNFAVFNKNDEFLNKYENLALDISDVENTDMSTSEKTRAENSGDESTGDVPVSETQNGNALDANQDFISIDLSSEDDEDVDDEANKNESQKGSEEPRVAGNYDYDNYDDEFPNEEEVGVRQTLNTDYPWILNHDHSKQREIADWLTLEIKDFVAYISPSREEIELRNATISKIRQAVKALWPDADLHAFGSFATDLYLPGSDIDCVINSAAGDKENRNCLYSLASFLKRRNLATQVEVISKARVPIIKFVEPDSRIHIDVSFERINGLEAAKIIRGWLKETPGLRELVLVVKQFLSSRRLNNVHTGGLGGFSIICLVYSFLQLHPRVMSSDIDSMDNLGVLLIDFFELYGKNFGYDDVAISVSDYSASFLPKMDYPSLRNPRTTFSLAIQDPGDPDNNISRGSFNIRDIKKAFAGAFDLLTNRCFELDSATFKDRLGKSILGNVIKYRGKQREFKDERALVVNRAIEENELYYRKRGRIVHEEVFTDVSEDEQDVYKVESPARKKSKKSTKSDGGETSKKKAAVKKVVDQTERQNVKSVEDLLGLQQEEDEGDDYVPPAPVGNVAEGDAQLSTLREKSVDAQTRRDYWLSKGQAL